MDRDRVQNYTAGDYGKQSKTGLRWYKMLHSKNLHYELSEMNYRQNKNLGKKFNYGLNTSKDILITYSLSDELFSRIATIVQYLHMWKICHEH